MSNRRGHSPNLPIFAFDQFEAQPTCRDGFAYADGRHARGKLRRRFKYPRTAGKRFAALEDQSFTQIAQRIGIGNSFHLGPVFAFVSAPGMKQSLVQPWLVAQQEQSFRIGVEAAKRVDALRKSEFRKRAVGRAVWRELGENAIGFVECDEHDRNIA